MVGVREQLRDLVDELTEEQALVALGSLRAIAEGADAKYSAFPTRNVNGLVVAGDVFFSRQPRSLVEIAARQGVEPINDPDALHGDFWPADEGIDDFIESVREWRRESSHG